MWAPNDISFDLAGETTDDPVVTLVISTPAGTLRVMAELVRESAEPVHVRATEQL